jgi:hypothetical protein
MILLTNQELALKLSELESKYDSHFKGVFDAIRELMKQLDPPRLTSEYGELKNQY